MKNSLDVKQWTILILVVAVVGLVAGFIGSGISNSSKVSLSPGDINSYPDMVTYPGSLFLGYGKMIGFKTSNNNLRTMLQLVSSSNGPNTLRIGNDAVDGTDAVSIYTEGHKDALVVDKDGNVIIGTTMINGSQQPAQPGKLYVNGQICMAGSCVDSISSSYSPFSKPGADGYATSSQKIKINNNLWFDGFSTGLNLFVGKSIIGQADGKINTNMVYIAPEKGLIANRPTTPIATTIVNPDGVSICEGDLQQIGINCAELKKSTIKLWDSTLSKYVTCGPKNGQWTCS